jgi:formate/nitrite transporter FocA (FNT family)
MYDLWNELNWFLCIAIVMIVFVLLCEKLVLITLCVISWVTESYHYHVRMVGSSLDYALQQYVEHT